MARERACRVMGAFSGLLSCTAGSGIQWLGETPARLCCRAFLFCLLYLVLPVFKPPYQSYDHLRPMLRISTCL